MRLARRRSLSVALFITLAAWPRATQGAFIENFATGNAGWLTSTVNDGGGVGLFGSTYGTISAGQQGFIQGNTGPGLDRLFGFQPGETSTFASLTGLNLTTDFKIEGVINGPSTPMVRFYVGSYSGGRYDYFVSSDAYSFNPNTGTGWSTHGIALNASNFIEWPNSAAHSRTFDQVIAAPEDIGLVFTGSSNQFNNNQFLGFQSNSGATISITNFGSTLAIGSIPEPVSLILCALSAVLLLLKRHRSIA